MSWAKTLNASLKHKIIISVFQTLTKHILSTENVFKGFLMAEFTPLEVSAWIKKLNPSRSLVLDGFPTRIMMMMMMAMMIMMTMMMTVTTMMIAATVRHIPATSRGLGVTSDPTDRQTNIETNVQHISFSFSFIYMYFALYFLFETWGCI